ncbi:dTDP-4-dehydrorhamnose reductase [Paracoccus saliphilus]|uniref:dTDP-4-dehydrorhamnose reductase n=1 Tax=Paracoccus saliphilus TaxID=405559 RepID=A0AA46A7L0_9RHOB|nr:dTDP-4-dehydrorhamnose reductase [Paracoccus saliphilus]WCR05544.1 dTDP-4-dehydrorhamnose reductase [Paracoccus saliphilus]SIT15214.1 dTDP-4-dehydrorhamnose reductase [Paracoccus saliphilus]
MEGLLVFGRTGQLARELTRLAPRAQFLGRDAADLADPAACASMIRNASCTAVINAAAYTAVDRAESEPKRVQLVNADAPAAMARATAEKNIPFLHVSTDYVFDGTGNRPWIESDPAGPLGIYGASKLEGERKVAAAGGQSAVLRTSWVFSAHGSNFVKSMLCLGKERSELNIVSDQVGGPTPAADIAAALLVTARAMQTDRGKGGLYHFAGAPDVSWAGFAREIFAQAGQNCYVSEISTADYPTPARRPGNSRLNCDRIAADFGISRPDWRVGLAGVLDRLRGSA